MMEKVFALIGDIHKTLGRIEGLQNSHKEYLDAVNANLKEMRREFSAHISDDSKGFNSIKEMVARIETVSVATANLIQSIEKDGVEDRQEFADHVEDNEAHGAKSRGEVWGLVGKVFAGVIAAVPVLWWFFKVVQDSNLKP